MIRSTVALTDVLPVHPRTGLTAVGFSRRGPIWPILGGAEDDEDKDGAGEDDSDEDDSDEDKDGEIDWEARAKAAETDRDRWKSTSRKHEDRAKSNAKAARERDELKRKGMSADEATVQAARDEERAKVRTEFGGRLVEAELRGRASTRMTDDQISTLLDGLDRNRFLDDDGDVDVEAVREFVEKIAPKKSAKDDDGDDGKGKDSRGGAGMGQGRGKRGTATGLSAGRARYDERRTARAAQTGSKS